MSDRSHEPETLLDRPALRLRFKCSTSSIKRYEVLGLRAIKLGPRLVRYRLSDVIAFEERTQSAK